MRAFCNIDLSGGGLFVQKIGPPEISVWNDRVNNKLGGKTGSIAKNSADALAPIIFVRSLFLGLLLTMQHLTP